MAVQGHVSRRLGLVDDLLRERGIRRYGLFGLSHEGEELPDGSESASGHVVDAEGRVFFFWLDWDKQTQRVAFTEWVPIDTAAEFDWQDDEPEYVSARRAAGLNP